MTKRFCIFVASATLALAFCAPAHADPPPPPPPPGCVQEDGLPCAGGPPDFSACASNPVICLMLF